jgi:Tol biopolymer transport system component
MKRHTAFALAVLLLAATAAHAATTELISVNMAGNPADGNHPAISANGRYVAFESFGTGLVPGDTNGFLDVFVYDRATGVTTRVSVASDGSQGNGGSSSPAISADGRYVTFSSGANNLVPDGTSEWSDVLLHDRVTGETTRVSTSIGGGDARGGSSAGGLSADGRYVVFSSGADNLVPGDTNVFWDVFVLDRQTGETTRVSVATDGTEGNGLSLCATISPDGRYVAFESEATNLVAGDTNGVRDVYVHDRATGETIRASVASDGTGGSDGRTGPPALSGDGRYVAFACEASDLVPDDTNGCYDVFVHDLVTRETERVSVSSEGAQGNGTSGLFWMSLAISYDGRYVAFSSAASNLVPGDTNSTRDIFVHDRTTGETRRVSLRADGSESRGDGQNPAMSADGTCIAFSTQANLIIPGESYYGYCVFVRDELGFGDIGAAFWCHDEIRSCVAAGVVSGYGDGTYQPGNPVTRDQMAVYVARALAGGDGYVPEFTDTPTFPDVPEESWALKYVEYAVAHNVVAGYLDGTYHPEYEVTRDQMAVYVARALVAPTGEAALADYVPADPRDFPDVASDFWSYKHVEYCVENGVVAGYLDGLYHPDYVVTRDQMAVYVARAFGLVS